MPGDPVEAAAAYDAAGADELCFLDITASHENRGTILDVVARTAERCFMPLTVGGGVRDGGGHPPAAGGGRRQGVDQHRRRGQPRSSWREARREVRQPVHRGGHRRQARVGDGEPDAGRSSPMAGASPPGIDAVEFAREVVALGAGEILLTSMDRDGTKAGYDLR